MLPFRLALLALLIATSTVVHVVPLLLLALLKVLLPVPRLRIACNPLLTGLAESWIGVNNLLWDVFTRTRLTVEGTADLHADGHYLVLANHQSWVDILVLQKVFNRRIPLLRFFLKRQLFWVPLLGMAWWALDFPFMGRYTPKQIARNPALAGRDIAATRREAVEAASRQRPGLVLADIQLADGSSGIDAVKDILQHFDVPVIFITAFPERLLTGERPEPTFLITKPFQPETVKAAIGQALFFHPARTKRAA